MILISCYTDDHFRSFNWNWLLCPNCVGKHAKGLLHSRLKNSKKSALTVCLKGRIHLPLNKKLMEP